MSGHSKACACCDLKSTVDLKHLTHSYTVIRKCGRRLTPTCGQPAVKVGTAVGQRLRAAGGPTCGRPAVQSVNGRWPKVTGGRRSNVWQTGAEVCPLNQK
eukprot:52308-Chlamydomonas_euryale.AAC.1